VPVAGGPTVELTRRLRVRLADISEEGALLATEERLVSRMTGRLQVMLGFEPFEANVEIKRIQREGAAGLLAGVAMRPVDRRYREGLDQFLRRAEGHRSIGGRGYRPGQKDEG
jgi:hypothetical protein